jgi:4'-phosphopantetheinyl transferase
MSLQRGYPEHMSAEELHIEVRCVRLNCTPETLHRCWSILDSGEVARARTFAFDHLTTGYVQAHALLRVLIGNRLRLSPRQIVFEQSEFGKPRIADNRDAFEFNMSHSGGVALYAFAHGCAIGVDIERFRIIPDAGALVSHYFSPLERAEFDRQGTGVRMQAFWNGWTRKEAYIKATGRGLSMPLDEFTVTLRPGGPAILIPPVNKDVAQAQWQLHHLDPAPAYIGALVYSGPPRCVEVFEVADAETLLNGPLSPELRRSCWQTIGCASRYHVPAIRKSCS